MKHSLTISDKYDDIINLPHHQSKTRPQMSIYNRAAQFSLFAALTGYEDAIMEKARLTKKRPELDENEIAYINEQLVIIQNQLDSKPIITISYFEYDNKKDGGSIITKQGTIKKINTDEYHILLQDNTFIPIDYILRIDFSEDDFETSTINQ